MLVCILCVTSFSSCEKAGTELSDLMIIQGIGVDYKNGQYTVTVEILNNEQSGSPSGDSVSENKTKIYSIKGKSVSEALRLLTTKSGNLPLFAHNRVIVVNEDLNEKKISDVLEFFVRNFDSRATQLICVSKGKTAQEIIRAKLLKDTVKSEILENLLVESYNQSIIPRVRVIDAVNTLRNKAMVLCVPAVSVKKNGENEDYELKGCAVFDENGRVSRFINNEQAKGLTFLNNDAKQGFLTQPLSNGENVTIIINKSTTRYKVTTENGRLVYHLTIDISCDIDEIEKTNGQETDAQIIEDLQKTIKKAVSGRIKNTMQVLQKTDGGDCIRFCKVAELQKPQIYKVVKNNWQQVFENAKTKVSVNVKIRRIGEEILDNKN